MQRFESPYPMAQRSQQSAATTFTSGEYFVAMKPGGSCSRCSRWSVLPAAWCWRAEDATDATTVTRMTTARHAATASRLHGTRTRLSQSDGTSKGTLLPAQRHEKDHKCT